MDVFGWQSTKWGMTELEIIDSIGNEYVFRKTREDFGKYYSELTIPIVEIGPYDFAILFQMNKLNDRLSKVLIRHDGEPDENQADAANSSRRILTEKYGVPQREGTTNAWIWRFPTTTIVMSHHVIADLFSFTAIAYMPTEDYTGPMKPPAF